MEISTWLFSRMDILKSAIIFLNLVLKIPFLSKFGCKTSKCFVLATFRYTRLFRVLILILTIPFLNSVPKASFFGEKWSWNSKLLCFKWNLTYSSIQRCWFWFQNFLLKLSLKAPSCCKFIFKTLCIYWKVAYGGIQESRFWIR